jgi:hypothetical protein
MEKSKFLLHLLYFIILAVIVTIEFFYREPMIEVSITMMRYLQTHETEAGKYFFIWLSNIGLGVPYIIAILIILITNSERGRAFYHVFFICACLFVMGATKMVYGEPRLFWWINDIYPDECTTDYGNPSGHTELAIAYPMMLYLDIFENSDVQRVRGNRMSIG